MKSFTDMYLDCLYMIQFIEYTKSDEVLEDKLRILSFKCKNQNNVIESKFSYFSSKTIGKKSLESILEINSEFDDLKDEFNHLKDVIDDVPEHIKFNL